MGQKINPIGFRLAVRRDWHSQWFARKQTFADQLLLDYQVRNHIEERFSQAMIAKIEIVRQEKIQIKIHCAKPGLIIGSKGEDIEMLRKTVRRMIGSKGRGVELLRKSLRQIIGSKGEGIDKLCKIIGQGSNISDDSLDKMFTQLRKTIRPSPSSANDDRRRSPSQVVSISDNIDELLRIVCKMTNSLNSEELPRVLRRIYKTAGSKDDDIDLPKTIRQIIDSEVDVDIREIRKAETNATLVARNIAIQLEKRVMFRRAMRRALMNAERVGVKGIKIMCKGRLNGAEIARFERYHRGRVPLHTLRANIDYGFAEAKTSMGVIGIKVWIFHGETPARLKRDRAREEEALSRKVEISPEVTEETTASEELIAEAQKKEAKKRLRGRYDPNAAADSKPETFSEEDFGDDLDDFYTEGDDAGT